MESLLCEKNTMIKSEKLDCGLEKSQKKAAPTSVVRTALIKSFDEISGSIL
jgi:hypothetical protein